jgi:RNA polymerase sigma-70 factor (ECF subfamily)
MGPADGTARLPITMVRAAGPTTAGPLEPEAATPPEPGAASSRHAAGVTADSRQASTFETAVAPLWPALVRRLTLVVGDPDAAQDIAQDAYLRAFQAWDRFDGDDVRAWLYTIALRLAFNERRRHRRWLAAIRRLGSRPWHDPVDPDLQAALQRLEPRARSALLLTIVDGYTQREVAAMLGVPEGTVASWISRARAKLRADLDRG